MFGYVWMIGIFETESSHSNIRVVKVTCLERLEAEQRTHRGIAEKGLVQPSQPSASENTRLGRGVSQIKGVME